VPRQSHKRPEKDIVSIVLFVNKKRVLALPNSHICEPLLNIERVCSVVYDLEAGKQETSHAGLGEITESLKAVTCSLSEL
jgi:hypothetical protein